MSETRILYIEDELFLAKIVREYLESRGWVVHHLPDGRGAVAACEQFQPHICILDVMLPYEDGFSVGKDLHKRFPKTPIIYLTAKDQTEDVLAGFAAGGNDYLRKPFSMEELIVRLKNLIALSGSDRGVFTDQEPVSLGQLLFNPTRQELQHGAQTKRLSHRETQLLEMLVKNLNQEVLRKDILLLLWGNDSYFNSRNLDVYIARLREYLRPDPNVEIITLKGIGYRLVVQ